MTEIEIEMSRLDSIQLGQLWTKVTKQNKTLVSLLYI